MKLVIMLLLLPAAAFGQAVSSLDFPPKSDGMPSWAERLYDVPLNLRALDSSYAEFYSRNAYEKNNYTKFYRRLQRKLAPFVREDGTVEQLSAPEVEKKFGAEQKQLPPTNATMQAATKANWRNLQMDTRWKVEDRAEQPQCPWQVNIYGFDISRSNPNILVCGSETAGIYRTTDKGLTWKQVGAQYALGTEAISIHPTNPNIIILGTNGAIRRTDDAGKTWTTTLTLGGFDCNDIEIHHTNPSLAFACGNLGLFRSTDGGLTWNQILTQSVCELEIHPTNPNMVYVLRRDATNKLYEFWKSSDGGQTFSLKSSGWKNLPNSGGRMTVTPAAPNVAYAVILTDAEGPKIMKTTDAGETWTLAAQGSYSGYSSPTLKMDNGQGYYDLSIVVSQTDANQVIVGTQTTYRTADGGATWTALGGYTGPFPIHPDLQEAKALGNDTWIATDGGMTLSADFFADVNNATARNTGLNGSDFWGFDAGWNDDVMVGGRYHNGNTAVAEGFGGKFLRLGGGEAATGYVNPMRARKTYHSDIGGYVIPDSANGRSTAFRVGKWPSESYYAMEFGEMAWDPRCYGTVFIGSGNGIFRSDNDGARYEQIFTSPDNGAVMEHIEISRSNPDVMYCTQRLNSPGAGKLWRSADGGITWKLTAMPTDLTPGQARVMCITLSGTNPNLLWAAFRSAPSEKIIYRSNDGGATWENLTTPAISGNRPSHIMHQLGTNGGVYLACDGGNIYYRNSAMQDWAYFGDGLPVSHFTRALKPFYRDGKLRVGSNQGIWETELYEPSAPVAQPTVDKRRTSCVRDTFYFDDYSALTRANATWKWQFPGASFVSSAADRNPRVVYAQPGTYSVTLTVSNSYGTDTKTLKDVVEVLPNECGMDSTRGMAMNMSATNDVLQTDVMTNLRGAETFTVAAWVKLDTIQQSFSQIMSNWSSNVGFSFGFSFQGYRANTNLTFYSKGVPYQLTSPFNLPVNEWAHVGITIEPEKATLYFNGTPWEYKGNFTGFDLASTPFEIGGGLPGQGGNFRGQLDELRIYRRALTTEEFRRTIHLIPTDTTYGLAALYQFNEQMPARIYDRLGGAHCANSGSGQVVSTAPVAVGESDVANTVVGRTILPNTGVNVNSEVNQQKVVAAYRLGSLPDSVIPGKKFTANEHWILRAWGEPLAANGLQFGGLAFLREKQYLPQSFTLYKRDMNSHHNTWTEQGTAEDCDYGQFGAIFPINGNAVGQYMIAFSPVTGVQESSAGDAQPEIRLIGGEWTVVCRRQKDSPQTATVYSLNGQMLCEFPLTSAGDGYCYGKIPPEFARVQCLITLGEKALFFPGAK